MNGKLITMTESLSDRLMNASKAFPFGGIKSLLQEAAIVTDSRAKDQWRIVASESRDAEDFDPMDMGPITRLQDPHINLNIYYRGELVFSLTTKEGGEQLGESETKCLMWLKMIWRNGKNVDPLSGLQDAANRIS